MNEQELKNLELKNLIVTKDLEIYKLRTELALAQKQVKELTSYLDQVTTPVKEKVTPEQVKNEKDEPHKKGNRTGRRPFTEEMLIAKYQNSSSVQPYLWYKRRGCIIPDWAKEASNKYQREMRDKRNMNLSPADYIESLAQEALETSREIADFVK